ncbi:MAG TPA: hypothetical protein VMV89_04915 [Candidatus Paceibacterota bacterium]|nr:hypothetical protein [Candidatus Paceibacterota bacterium]
MKPTFSTPKSVPPGASYSRIEVWRQVIGIKNGLEFACFSIILAKGEAIGVIP